MKKVFLGGTTNNSDWRDTLIKKLKIDYFNPVVKDWNEAAQKEEIKQRKNCDYVLYVITPKMEGVYSIAEVVDDSNKRPEKTIFAYLLDDDSKEFGKHQIKSLDMVGKMVKDNGGKWFKSLGEIADFLNFDKNLQFGGQHKNTTDSCVVITHIPTGIKVVRDGRSQHKNKDEALTEIRERLNEFYLEDHMNKVSKERKGQIGNGNRGSEKKRTYNQKMDLVIDHESDKSTSLKQFMKGKLELLMC